jgi:hypothetical protein
MKIAFSTSDKDKKNSLVRFLDNNKNFYFLKIGELRSINEKKIIFIFKNIDKDYLKKIIEVYYDMNTTLIVHRSDLSLSYLKNLNLIQYPINFLNFEKLLFSENEEKNLYMDTMLIKNNVLLNTVNKKQTYLTETELNIMKLLIKKITVSREKIKKEILNLNVDIETKSLDSHLSRIRKKIREVDLEIEILSPNPKEIKLS